MEQYYSADFETTTDPTDCRVWSWGLVDVFDATNHFEWGTDITSFMHRVFEQRCIVYFHNLAFDGRFILYWLLTNGYRHVEGKGKLYPKTFGTAISKDGKFYQITVQCSKKVRIEFRDSLKKLPMTVDRIAKAFRLEMTKGTIDYHAPRPIGHTPTDDELSYLRNDCAIVGEAMKLQLMSGMKKLTVGSDSLYEYKNVIGGKDAFERLFPVLAVDIDTEIRAAYRGGWTYADPRHRGKVREETVRVYDVNSLYPSVMYDRELPVGTPVWSGGAPHDVPGRPLWVGRATFSAKLKPNHVPCIQIKKSAFFLGAEYQTEVEDVTMSFTSVDWALWNDQYDIDVAYWEGVWYFESGVGMFSAYIDKWMNVKRTTSGGLREIAKLHLNSLYGKFATNLDVTPKVPAINESGILELRTGTPDARDPVYTPVGVFITAYARDVTIRAAQANYDQFAYADTDSLHLFTDADPDGLHVDPDALGAWKFEGQFDAALYVRPKCYAERRADGTYDVHVAGLPRSVASTLTFADFTEGRLFDGKLTPKSVPGGVVLMPIEWRLSDPALRVDMADGMS